NVSRQKMLPHATHLMREIEDTALELLRDAWKAPTPIRLLSVTALHLTESQETYEQLDLLGGASEGAREKQEAVEDAMARIRAKYGKGAISYAKLSGNLGKVTDRD
ncbi:MAG: DNA polymerase IV, partial [Ruminococcaceae bacterium]|nr:DNA polymerase IV [Oscillospiraceae bacterium]